MTCSPHLFVGLRQPRLGNQDGDALHEAASAPQQRLADGKQQRLRDRRIEVGELAVVRGLGAYIAERVVRTGVEALAVSETAVLIETGPDGGTLELIGRRSGGTVGAEIKRDIRVEGAVSAQDVVLLLEDGQLLQIDVGVVGHRQLEKRP